MRSRSWRLSVLALAAAGSASPVLAAEPVAVPQPTLTPGDDWVYDAVVERGINGFQENHYEARIEDVRDDGLILGIKRQGAPTAFQDHELGLDWSERRLDEGKPIVGDRPYAFPLSIGKTWDEDYDDPTHSGLQTSAHVHKTYKVIRWEDVHTPAGDFHALRIEAHGTLKAQIAAGNAAVAGAGTGAGATTAILQSQITPAHVEYGTTYAMFDYAPQVRSFVKSVHETYNAAGVRVRRETRTLEQFKPAS